MIQSKAAPPILPEGEGKGEDISGDAVVIFFDQA
jgi:hypothetical protein